MMPSTGSARRSAAPGPPPTRQCCSVYWRPPSPRQRSPCRTSTCWTSRPPDTSSHMSTLCGSVARRSRV
ncbi:hypothetical protein JYU34_011635 [Plutella xylostella]|uniref:Uncharacterized protein n=1 Tax=Plutella xylostella TaxID=51655 RepID=A0ABQ7QD83_PLUXY|nr:hypothetical protein JYU34_011635 [Plutella xylostella]